MYGLYNVYRKCVFKKSKKTGVALEALLMAFYQRLEAGSAHCLGHCGDVKHRDSIKTFKAEPKWTFLRPDISRIECSQAEKPGVMSMSSAAVHTAARAFRRGARPRRHAHLRRQRDDSFHGGRESLCLEIHVHRSGCHSRLRNGRNGMKGVRRRASVNWLSGPEVKYQAQPFS